PARRLGGAPVPADGGGRGTVDAVRGDAAGRPARRLHSLDSVLLRPGPGREPGIVVAAMGGPRRLRRGVVRGGGDGPAAAARQGALLGGRGGAVGAVRVRRLPAGPRPASLPPGPAARRHVDDRTLPRRGPGRRDDAVAVDPGGDETRPQGPGARADQLRDPDRRQRREAGVEWLSAALPSLLADAAADGAGRVVAA